ncbi:MAG: hypothetical protein Q9214_003336, partial [Letrouitia sp. 1 TL-2023]
MATVAHCLYGFEVLSANLEKRDHLSLRQVEDLWTRYQKLDEHGNERGTSKQPQRDETDQPGATTASAADDEQDDEELMLDSDHEIRDPSSDDDGDDDEPPLPEQPNPVSTLRLPSISRLQASSSPASASTASTPSTLSASSSRQALSETSSKTSSSSSFFSSFSRRSHQPSPSVVPKEERYPLFVTWNTISSRSHHHHHHHHHQHRTLRGCIGTFDAQDLSSGLKNYALTA